MSAFGFDISFVIGGSEEKDLHRCSVAFERAGFNMTRFADYVWPGLELAMEAIERDQFELEGAGPIAGAWAPLTLKYEERKAKKYPGQPINVRSGAMRAAFTDSASPFAARMSSDAEMVFGTQGVPYASFPQTGTSKMVPRPPVDFGDEFEALARREVAKGVRQAIHDAGVSEFGDIYQGGDD